MDKFDVLVYDGNNNDHRDFVRRLENDEDILKYTPSLSSSIKQHRGLIVKYEDTLIGGFVASNLYGDYIDLQYAILKEYRNKRYGYTMVGIALDLLKKQSPSKTVLLNIAADNNQSIAIAKKFGFSLDYDMCESFSNEGQDTPYIKTL